MEAFSILLFLYIIIITLLSSVMENQYNNYTWRLLRCQYPCSQKKKREVKTLHFAVCQHQSMKSLALHLSTPHMSTQSHIFYIPSQWILWGI
jgi:hypothetical protein